MTPSGYSLLPRTAEDLANDWWDGFETHDIERLVGMFSADATFWDPRFQPFKGTQNIRLYYTDLLGKTVNWGGERSPVYVMDANHFAVHTRTRFELAGVGKTIDFPMVGFFNHRDGFIIGYKEYWDTAYMLRQFGPGAKFPPGPVFV